MHKLAVADRIDYVLRDIRSLASAGLAIRLEALANMRILRWRTHDGRRMLVSEMSDSHLANAINMIYRGCDAHGRRVLEHTRRALPALLVEQEIRNIRNYDNPLWC